MSVESKAFSFVMQKLRKNGADKNELITWMNSLKRDIFNKVFLLNVYIDLKKNYLNVSSIVDIINKMDRKKEKCVLVNMCGQIRLNIFALI